MFIHRAFAFDTNGILQWATACVRLQTFAAVTNPGFTEVTNGTDHAEAGSEHTRMTDNTIARLQHAFDFAALRTDGQALHTLTEVAEGTRFLFSLAFVALKE